MDGIIKVTVTQHYNVACYCENKLAIISTIKAEQIRKQPDSDLAMSLEQLKQRLEGSSDFDLGLHPASNFTFSRDPKTKFFICCLN